MKTMLAFKREPGGTNKALGQAGWPAVPTLPTLMFHTKVGTVKTSKSLLHWLRKFSTMINGQFLPYGFEFSDNGFWTTCTVENKFMLAILKKYLICNFALSSHACFCYNSKILHSVPCKPVKTWILTVLLTKPGSILLLRRVAGWPRICLLVFLLLWQSSMCESFVVGLVQLCGCLRSSSNYTTSRWSKHYSY